LTTYGRRISSSDCVWRTRRWFWFYPAAGLVKSTAWRLFSELQWLASSNSLVPSRLLCRRWQVLLAPFRTARAALTKSGTSTLELALAGVPMVAAYRVLLVEAIAARLILKIPSVILANLVLGENVVPEFLQWHCTPKRLAAALLPLLNDTPERRRQTEAFGRLDGIMEVGRASPSDRSAALVLDIVGQKSRLSSEPAALGPATA
jgi:Lipid-A-disaccharide synthetase